MISTPSHTTNRLLWDNGGIIRLVHFGGGSSERGMTSCGKSYLDVNRSTIHPHHVSCPACRSEMIRVGDFLSDPYCDMLFSNPEHHELHLLSHGD